MQPPSIEVRGVSKSFSRSGRVLDQVSLAVAPGEMVALIGASGSGKSTLIRSIAGLVPVDPVQGGEAARGEIIVAGCAMQRGGAVSGDAKVLRSRIGIVFQQFNLVPRLSVLKNVCLGLLGHVPRWRGTIGRFTHGERQRAMHALARVGIADQALKRGSELSGGQQQRAAIARSLLQGSEILIADEPIASLDPSSARRVMDIIAELNRNDGITVLVSLHQVEYALSYCPRTIALRAGKVVYDGPSRDLTPELLGELYGTDAEDVLGPDPARVLAARNAVPAAMPLRAARRDEIAPQLSLAAGAP